MVLLSLNSGMRSGEVFGLEWGDVNLEERFVKVRAENAKTGKARHLPRTAFASPGGFWAPGWR
jgi:integrase